MTQRYAGDSSAKQARDHECSFGKSEDEMETQERELRGQVEKTLRDESAYSRDEFEDIMIVLRSLGVRSIKHFKHLKTDDFVAKGLPLVTARILMGKFGDKDGDANKKEFESSRVIQRKSCWDYLMQFLDHELVSAVAKIGLSTVEKFLHLLVDDYFDRKRVRRTKNTQKSCRT